MSGAYIIIDSDHDGTDDDYIFFDLGLGEDHSKTAQVTSHPVEKGETSEIADNMRADPDTFTLTMCCTNTPIVPDSQKDRGRVDKLDMIARPATGVPIQFSAQVLQFDDVFDSIQETQEALEKVFAKELLTVVTDYKTYENVGLIGIRAPIEKVGRVDFELTFQKLRIVESKNVPAPQPKEPRGQGETSKGQTETQEDTNASDSAKKKSFAASLRDQAADFLKGLGGEE